MGKLAVITCVFLGVLCSIAQAHRPIFSDKAATDPNTAVLISQPAISQVIYREITDEADQVWLAFDVNEGFDLFIQIGVPVLDRLKEFRPAMVVVGPGMPKDDLPFGEPDGIFPTDAVKEPRFFHEHFTGTDSWILRSDTVKMPKSGRYYLVAYVPSGDKGKLWLSVGKKESFGIAEWTQFGEWKKKIRTFHEVSETGGGLRIPILSDIGDILKSGGSPKSTADGTIVEAQLSDNGQALINPDMGWTMHYYSNIITNYGSRLEPSDTLEDFPGLSTVYLRVPWAFIEPEEGNYNWSLLDTPAQRWIDKGKRIAIRLTTSENWMRYATPEWVQKAGAKGYFYQYGQGRNPTGSSWDPDFNDPVYLKKLDTFLANMAKRYDNNPNVAFIDIGTFGLWGECPAPEFPWTHR